MKYIRHKTMGFYLFPPLITHEDFAIMNCLVIKDDIISAGFIYDGKCYGKSVSLGIGSHPDDTADLLEQLGMEATI